MAYMQETLQSLGLAAIRIPAVDGREINDSTCRQFNPLNDDLRALSKSEIGCFLSHRDAWQRIVAGDHRWACIFEDDIAFSKDAGPLLSDLCWLPDEPAIVRIEAGPPKPVLLGVRHTAVGQEHFRAEINSLSLGTAAYFIDQDTAQRLLMKTGTFRLPLDREILDPAIPAFADIKRFQVAPAICIQQKRMPSLSFLPEGAEISGIDDETGQIRQHASGGQRRTGLAKLKREVQRPFEQLSGLYRRTITALMTNSRWTHIPFKH